MASASRPSSARYPRTWPSSPSAAARGAHRGNVFAPRRVVAGPQVELGAEEADQLMQIGSRGPVAEPPAHARAATVAGGGRRKSGRLPERWADVASRCQMFGTTETGLETAPADNPRRRR